MPVAVSLDELAQVGLPPVETSVQQQVGVRIGKGLFLDDTQQELCFGDTPQVSPAHLCSPLVNCIAGQLQATQYMTCFFALPSEGSLLQMPLMSQDIPTHQSNLFTVSADSEGLA